MSIRIVIADDQSLIRAGIGMLLSVEPDMEVLAEAADGQETIELVLRLQPDVVVMDVRMPNMDGVTATRMLTANTSKMDKVVKILILTTFNDDDVVYGALRAGASGFLLKHAAPRDLVASIRAIAAGDAWIDPAIAGKVITALANSPSLGGDSPQRLAPLTAREREVLILVAHGLSTTEIKDRLYLSEATVKTHISRILLKTGSRDRAQAVALAYRSGLVTAPTHAS